MILKRQNMSENNWNHFKIVPKGHNHCQLSIVNCQFGEAAKFLFPALPCVADGYPGFHAVLPVKQGLDLLAVNTGKQQRRHKSAGYLRHRECPPHIMDIARQAQKIGNRQQHKQLAAQ